MSDASPSQRLPIILLGGSDDQPGPIPETLGEHDMLHGPKGLLEFPDGTTLAEKLIQQLRDSDCFADPVLVGPRQAFENHVSCEIADSHGNLSVTLENVHHLILEKYPQEAAVAICTTDILPTADQFRQLIHEGYLPHQQAAFWGELVQAEPELMGASGWKPSYQIRPEPSALPQTFYPGHLVVLRPAAIRIRMMIHLLKLAYQHRNLEISKRPRSLLKAGLWGLIQEDAANLLKGQFPQLFWSIPYHGFNGYMKFRGKKLTIQHMEQVVAHMFLHRRERRLSPRPVVFAISNLLAFAKDIDAKAEWEEVLQRERNSGT